MSEQQWHILKIQAHEFEAILQGGKHFEIRYDDRNYQVNDILVLRELSEFVLSKREYTGRVLIRRVDRLTRLSDVSAGNHGKVSVQAGEFAQEQKLAMERYHHEQMSRWVVMGIVPWESEAKDRDSLGARITPGSAFIPRFPAINMSGLNMKC